mmetsp:Transcript_129238/g.182227  ORF Transcript_129238/g.182227 Transcript_129238/m.182227 type:complete len:271 (+) Transcript_129238:422-1234(+)
MTQGQLRCHIGQGIPRGLGCQRTAARQPGVHLDNAKLRTLRIHGVLDVALTHDTQVSDDLQGTLPEPVVFIIVQGLRWCNHDGFTCMNAHRIKVFHVAHGDAVVVFVTHHFVLQFFPTLQRLVNDHLWTVHQCHAHQLFQVLLVVCKTTSQTSEGISCAYQYRITNLLSSFHGVGHRITARAFSNLLTTSIHNLAKELTIFRLHDGINLGSQDFNVVLLEDSSLIHLHSTVQCCLPTPSGKDTIRLLTFNNFHHKLGCHWEKIDPVCHSC